MPIVNAMVSASMLKLSSQSLSLVIGVFMTVGAFADQPLDAVLKKRTLDLETPKERSLQGALSELAARYKSKYGEELPIFISVELLAKASPEKPKLTAIPGINPPVMIDPADARLDDRMPNCPIVEILHFYAGISNSVVTIQDGVILFRSLGKNRSPKSNPKK